MLVSNIYFWENLLRSFVVDFKFNSRGLVFRPHIGVSPEVGSVLGETTWERRTAITLPFLGRRWLSVADVWPTAAAMAVD
jgi:hypothetical protein